MKNIKNIIFLGILFISATAFILNTEIVEPSSKLVWHTDFEKARKLAIDENKVVFAFFTGSDWCGWCKKLQSNVFAKSAFIKWANDNVVLLELDFPRRTPLSEELKKQNYELASAFKVRGYPTVWLFNADFNNETKSIELQAYGSGGYPSGAVAGKEEVKFIADMNKILLQKK